MDDIPLNPHAVIGRLAQLDPRLVEVAVLQLENEKLKEVLDAKTVDDLTPAPIPEHRAVDG